MFLGQKYGYRPIPTYILSSELQLLRDELAAGGTDVTLLDMWYRKDSNAVPPISVLQPISSILINFNNKVCISMSIVISHKRRDCVPNPRKIIVLVISLNSFFNKLSKDLRAPAEEHGIQPNTINLNCV